MDLDLFPLPDSSPYKIIDSKPFLQLQSSSKLSLTLKTSGIIIVGIGLSSSPGTGYYLPVDQPQLDPAFDHLKSLLKRDDLTLCVHDAKSQLKSFADIECRIIDTMISSQLLNYEKSDLKWLTERLLPETVETMGTSNAESIQAARDVDYTFRLGERFENEIKQRGIMNLFAVEMDVLKVLASMEQTGVKIDVAWLQSIQPGYEKRVESLRDRIWEITGEFNINSNQQLAKKLFDDMKFPVIRQTKKGNSVDAGVLEELKKRTAHALFDLLLEYRSEEIMLSTFVRGLQKQVDQNSRTHTTFTQCVSTGRLSSSGPNMQNLPDAVRRAIVPENGNVILSLDYSQIELRVLAYFSQDATLIDSFLKGEDIHRRTASEIYGVKPDDVTPEMRKAAKTMNFALIYGAGEWSVGASLGITFDEARAFMKRYFDRLPGVCRFIAETKKAAHRNGYVETLLKRRIPIVGINSSDFKLIGRAERIATNAPIQGSAADIIKIAMKRVFETIEHTRTELILQVHDELVFEVPKGEVNTTAKTLNQIMERPPIADFSVPLVVDAEYGPSYGELVFLDNFA